MTSSDRVTFNLSGTSFDVSDRTFEQLKHLSDKSSVLIGKAHMDTGSKREVFLEQDPACFAALLYFCRQGELHLPTVICPQVFKDEMQCWGVELNKLSNCCYNTMVSFIDDCAVVRKFEEGLSYVKKKHGHPIPVTIYQSIRVRVWKVLDRPSSSHFAKAYFLLLLFFLCSSLFSLIASTHSAFLRDMTQDEWKEALGDNYKDHEAFLRKRFGFKDEVKHLPPRLKRSASQRFSSDQRDLPIPPEERKRLKPRPDANQDAGLETMLQTDRGIVGQDYGVVNQPRPGIPLAGHSVEHSKSYYGTEENTTEVSEKSADVRQPSEVADRIETESNSLINETLDRPETQPAFLANENTNSSEHVSVRVQQTDPNLSVQSKPGATNSRIAGKQKDKKSTNDLRDWKYFEERLAMEYSPFERQNADQRRQAKADRPRVKRASPPKGQSTPSAPSGSQLPDTTETSLVEGSASLGSQSNETDVTNTSTEEDAFEGFSDYRARLDFLNYLDYVCLSFFTMDFILRILSCPSLSQFARSVLNLSDLIALLADYSMLIVGQLLPTEKYSVTSWDFIECLRIFRFIRFFRPLRDVIGFRVLVHSVKASSYEMLLLVLFLTSGVMIFSTLLYWCERANMKSIPDAFWWAIITMTTVGYGDIYPTTYQGKVVGSLCALSGVVLIAITIPVLVNNFLLFYGFAKVIVARQKESKEKALKEKWKCTVHYASSTNRVQVQPISKPPKLTLAKLVTEVKASSSTVDEKH